MTTYLRHKPNPAVAYRRQVASGRKVNSGPGSHFCTISQASNFDQHACVLKPSGDMPQKLLSKQHAIHIFSDTDWVKSPLPAALFSRSFEGRNLDIGRSREVGAGQ